MWPIPDKGQNNAALWELFWGATIIHGMCTIINEQDLSLRDGHVQRAALAAGVWHYVFLY